MPRNMSFALTAPQILDQSKSVTRRLGWADLKPGEKFWAVKKCMGLKPGEKIERLWLLECLSNTPGPLGQISRHDVIREGFPLLRPAEFVAMFTEEMGCSPEQIVNRIHFTYVDQCYWPQLCENCRASDDDTKLVRASIDSASPFHGCARAWWCRSCRRKRRGNYMFSR